MDIEPFKERLQAAASRLVKSYCDGDKVEFDTPQCPICGSSVNMRILGERKKYGTDWICDAIMEQNLEEIDERTLDQEFKEWAEDERYPEFMSFQFNPITFLRAIGDNEYHEARSEWMFGDEGDFFQPDNKIYRIADFQAMVEHIEQTGSLVWEKPVLSVATALRNLYARLNNRPDGLQQIEEQIQLVSSGIEIAGLTSPF